MISLLINTIDRYDNLHKILNKQLDYDIISEVLVMNNGGRSLDINHRKLKVLNTNFDVGLRSRWILGAIAKNDYLCVQDDDLIVEESVIEMLYSNLIYDHDKVYGIYGRQLDIFDTYNQTQFYFGNVDIILTRLAMFHKKNIPYILEAEERIIPNRYPLAIEFPYDDILISYTLKSVYNKRPKAIPIVEDGLVTELPTNKDLHTDNLFLDKRANIARLCKTILCHEKVLNTNNQQS